MVGLSNAQTKTPLPVLSGISQGLLEAPVHFRNLKLAYLFRTLEISKDGISRKSGQPVSEAVIPLVEAFKQKIIDRMFWRKPPPEQIINGVFRPHREDYCCPKAIAQALDQVITEAMQSGNTPKPAFYAHIDNNVEQEFGRFLLSSLPESIRREVGYVLFHSLPKVRRKSLKSEYKRFEFVAGLICETLKADSMLSRIKGIFTGSVNIRRSREGLRCWPAYQTEVGSPIVIQVRRGRGEMNMITPFGTLPVCRGQFSAESLEKLNSTLKLTEIPAPEGAHGKFYKIGEDKAEPQFCTQYTAMPPLLALTIWQLIKTRWRTNSLRDPVEVTQPTVAKDAIKQAAGDPAATEKI